uniref:CUB_2 domain-containing protein n=1 Tax=Caenorhabditis tropicalis TaxID=1561998 RepID=A0A1I7UBJ4_9PELO
MKLHILLFLPFIFAQQHYPFEGSSGQIYSPNYPDNYDNMADIVYTITVPTGNYIHLEFLDFLTEDSYDVLQIQQYANLSGDQTGYTVDIQANEVTLIFTSDLTTTYRGFAIQYQMVPFGTVFMPTNACPSVIQNAAYGIVTSPNYPSNYPDNKVCAFLINVDPGHLISLQFVAFNTEDGYDTLSVYDGLNSSAALIGTYSGKKIPATITSSGNSLYLAFSSDLVKNFSGFSGVYTSFVSNDFKRGVLPQELTTGSSRDDTLLKWLKNKVGAKKLIPK